MTVFINILDLQIDSTNIQDISPYVIICDNHGKELKRIIAHQGCNTVFNSQTIVCADTMRSILFYVYHHNPYRQDEIIGCGDFDFDDARVTPYEPYQTNIPISMQKIRKGKIKIQAEYNIGQILIGSRSQKMCSRKRSWRRNVSDCVLESDYGDIVCTPKRSNQTIPTPKIIVAVSPFYNTGAPTTQDGLVQIQLVDFYPHYNLFSMFDGQQPGTMFSFVQPHLRRLCD